MDPRIPVYLEADSFEKKIFYKYSLNIQMLCYFCANSQIYPERGE